MLPGLVARVNTIKGNGSFSPFNRVASTKSIYPMLSNALNSAIPIPVPMPVINENVKKCKPDQIPKSEIKVSKNEVLIEPVIVVDTEDTNCRI
jgi:hypothetical protein